MTGDLVREVVRESAQLVPDLLVQLVRRDVGRELGNGGLLLPRRTRGLTIEGPATLTAVPRTGAATLGLPGPGTELTGAPLIPVPVP
ncbi:hypothetical protein AB0M95_29845 [Sphaerisporangium sp. NPDC051017]|uniref:hypothetical protein n=1 Tax=Sphaerisporangium sp. NPDC051017 TaxID=3154636 RepID=UPI00341E1F6F